MSAESMMEGFDDVSMGRGGSVYMQQGNYQLRIVEVKNGFAQQGNFDFFVASFEVLESDNPKCPKGSHVDWMVAFKNPQTFGYRFLERRFSHVRFLASVPRCRFQQRTTTLLLFASWSSRCPRGFCFLGNQSERATGLS